MSRKILIGVGCTIAFAIGISSYWMNENSLGRRIEKISYDKGYVMAVEYRKDHNMLGNIFDNFGPTITPENENDYWPIVAFGFSPLPNGEVNPVVEALLDDLSKQDQAVRNQIETASIKAYNRGWNDGSKGATQTP